MGSVSTSLTGYFYAVPALHPAPPSPRPAFAPPRLHPTPNPSPKMGGEKRVDDCHFNSFNVKTARELRK